MKNLASFLDLAGIGCFGTGGGFFFIIIIFSFHKVVAKKFIFIVFTFQNLYDIIYDC